MKIKDSIFPEFNNKLNGLFSSAINEYLKQINKEKNNIRDEILVSFLVTPNDTLESINNFIKILSFTNINLVIINFYDILLENEEFKSKINNDIYFELEDVYNDKIVLYRKDD